MSFVVIPREERYLEARFGEEHKVQGHGPALVLGQEIDVATELGPTRRDCTPDGGFDFLRANQASSSTLLQDSGCVSFGVSIKTEPLLSNSGL